MKITDPGYISQRMFDKTLLEKFQNNLDDEAVRRQAITLIQFVRGSQLRDQILVDIFHAAKGSGHVSQERIAEIGFCMGLQFGFELALSYPPPQLS
jgi:dienelactone hydrolase